MSDKWISVTREEQIKKGSMLKIVGIDSKNSYDKISCKAVLHMRNRERNWIEILINREKNYYFNLTAYLLEKPMWGKWVKELYVLESE
jgi:hypothetical protein